MLGALGITLVCVGAMIGVAKRSSANQSNKDDSIIDDKERIKNGQVPLGTYHGMTLTGQCFEKRISDGRKIMRWRNSAGDLEEIDVNTMKVLRNLDEEQRTLNYLNNAKLAAPGTIAVPTGMLGYTQCDIDKWGTPKYICRGDQYRRVDTGEIYYVVHQYIYSYLSDKENRERTFKLDPKIKFDNIHNSHINFYVNEAGHIQSMTDEEIKKREEEQDKNVLPPEEDINKFIEIFNSYQKPGVSGYHERIRKGIPDYYSKSDYWEKYYFGFKA